jgi:hypothetical protein
MKLTIHQKALGCLIAAVFCTAGDGAAQIIVDQGQVVSLQGAPPLGPAQIGVVSTGGAAFGRPENAEVVKNLPYQAQAVTEIKQTLADGSHIVQTISATVARDNKGRTVRIQKLHTMGPWRSASDSTSGDSPTLTTIFDPVSKTHIDYTSDTKIAHVISMPNPPPGAVMATADGFAVSTAGGGGPGLNIVSAQGHADTAQASGGHIEMSAEPDAETKSLGTKNIEGLQADGTRTTSTIPAGAIGNDKDIVITHETWYSPDLKLVLLTTQDDPRFGQTTYSLKNIQRSDPDPMLFQIPTGDKIQKIPMPPQFR